MDAAPQCIGSTPAGWEIETETIQLADHPEQRDVYSARRRTRRATGSEISLDCHLALCAAERDGRVGRRLLVASQPVMSATDRRHSVLAGYEVSDTLCRRQAVAMRHHA